MGTKQVRLDEDVYAKIADEKRPNETFSEAIERLITDWSLTEFDLGLGEDDTEQFANAITEIEMTTTENVDETVDELNANPE
ncbi:antitoxin VapB family protein [Halovenus halobia]|uniref:antitoxin VapB family protein n=1 Tax=Halovenus halobia TaxID=3396622 RepID=UPI003F56B962